MAADPDEGRARRYSFVGRLAEAACYRQPMKVSDVLRMLQADGWQLVATRGSHRQFKHASKPGRVTVPDKPSDDLAPGTLNSIYKQAGLK
jgi:predicted RNA binding protein YcfA (HicA-like mRNA interferase family)